MASRRSWTYWGRLVAAGIALALTGWMLLFQRMVGGAVLTGLPLFYMVSSVSLGFALLSGLVFSCDSVSREKRDGTLGLLFLTDLRGVDITLGKLAASSLGALYGLVAVLPLLAIALLMGGVTALDYLRMVAVLLLTLGTSLAMGMLASVLTSDVRRSVSLGSALIAVLCGGGPLVSYSFSWVLERMSVRTEVIQAWEQGWFSSATPFSAFYLTHSSTYAAEPGRYGRSLLAVAAMGIVSLAVASLWLPRSWQDRASADRPRGPMGWMDRLRFWTPDARRAYRTQLLDSAPVAWLSQRHWLRNWLVWGFLIGSLLGLWISNTDWFVNDWWEPGFGVGIALSFHAALKIWIANEAPRQFQEDRQSGALELLLSTSQTIPDILEGRWVALRRQFLWPLGAVLLLDVWFLVGMLVETGVNNLRGEAEFLWTSAVCMALLLLDAWALGWAGLWSGLRSTGRSAVSGLVTRVLVLPWVAWFACLTVWGVIATSSPNRFSGQDERNAFAWMLGSWTVIGVANSLFWALRARHHLLNDFRQVASQPLRRRRWFRRSAPEVGPPVA